MFQIHRLEGFYWVGRTGGYAKAARAFPYPITQPAVHQQVKKLEGELEFALFERVSKDHMQLTPAGKKLYEFVTPFFEGLPALVRNLSEGDYDGDLKLRAASLHLRHLMPPWIKRVHKRWPKIHVHLEEHAEPDLAALRRGEVDLLVDHFRSIPADLATMHVATLRPFIVMPQSHPQAKLKRVNLSKFQDDTFIGYTNGIPRELQMQALTRHGVSPVKTLSASSADVILGFVEAGLGYSLIPWHDTIGPKVKGVAVAPLVSPKIEFPVHAAWRKDTPENSLLDAVLETAPKP